MPNSDRVNHFVDWWLSEVFPMNTCQAIGCDIIALYGAAVALFGGGGWSTLTQNFLRCSLFCLKAPKKISEKI
jgi:hypothetical protein